jgi:hypothetical protein
VKGNQSFVWHSLRLTAIGVVGLALLLTSMPAFSQSCALCYTQAASAGARMIQALKSGILVLIVPPTLMSLVVIAICYRKRNQFHDSDSTSESDPIW